MKKFQSLGKSLNKEEQKRIVGGVVQTMACSCMVNGHPVDTVVCNYSDFNSYQYCSAQSYNYCSSTYGTTTMDCSTGGPQ